MRSSARLPGRVITFYSYKGGTGRSMALANFAWVLAANGKRVLVIDWDLEAPGLHRYFRPFLIDPDLTETEGLIDAFWSLAAQALARSDESPSSASAAEIDVGEALDDATRRLRYEHFPSDGFIDFIAAGRQCETYSERVNTFDWKRFYELGGAKLFSGIKKHLRPKYDFILIDSRTGVSDTSGICTIQLPDQIVACFTLNRQSIDGVASVLRSIRGYRSPTIEGRKIDLYPLATRVENAEQRRLEVARKHARRVMAEFVPVSAEGGSGYWSMMELSYRPAYAFEEVLAAFGDATGAERASDSMASQIEGMSKSVARDERLRMPEITAEDRDAVLAKYALAMPDEASPRVEQHGSSVDAADVRFRRELFAKEHMWHGNGYRWRDLMSRRELDLITQSDRAGFGRTMSYYVAQSERVHTFTRQLDMALLGIIGVVVSMLAYWYYRYFVAFDVLALEMSYSALTREREQVAMIISALTSFTPFLFAAFLNRSPNKPHGVGMVSVLSMLVLGPLRGEIRDYRAEGAQLPAAKDIPR
jgi:cellulose biosynthesis protein BcsQ